jgi:hypothetical protein
MAKNPPDFLELRAFLSQESDTPDIKQQKLKDLFAAELLIGFGMDIKKAIDYSRRETGEALMGENPQDWMDAFTRTLQRLNDFWDDLEKN